MNREQQRVELHRTIWKIANDLRGSVDGWDYKQYVSPIARHCVLNQVQDAMTMAKKTAMMMAKKPAMMYKKIKTKEVTMNKIEKLIAELCPQGVEFKTLGEVCEVLRGKRLTICQLSNIEKHPFDRLQVSIIQRF